jgi:diguanylate cyclase
MARLYVNELNALSAERAAIESRLRGALERDEYGVVFDARVAAATSEVVVLEARIRWTNPERAAIATGTLSAAAEAAGLLVPSTSERFAQRARPVQVGEASVRQCPWP